MSENNTDNSNNNNSNNNSSNTPFKLEETLKTCVKVHNTTTVQWKPPICRLFWTPICPWSQRVRIAAAEKRIPLELIEVPRDSSWDFVDWFAEINPRRQVPALQVRMPCSGSKDGYGEWKTIGESHIICRFLDQVGAPDSTHLLPGDAHMKYIVRHFCDEADRSINSMYHYSMQNNMECKTKVNEGLDRIENLLGQRDGPFLLGNNFSLAEVSFAGFLHRMTYILLNFNQENIMQGRPNLIAFKEACLMRPSFLNSLPDQRVINEVYKEFIPRPFKPPPVKLYGSPLCPFSLRVRLLMVVMKIPHHTVMVDVPKPEWYRDINPNMVTPTLELSTGERLYESYQILRYLADNYHAENPLVSKIGHEDPLEQANVDYFNDELEKLVEPYSAYKKYTALNAESLAAMTDEKRAEAEGDLRTAIITVMKNLEELLQKQSAGPFFLGERLSLADFAALPLLTHTLGVLHQWGVLSADTYVRLQTCHATFRQIPGIDDCLKQVEQQMAQKMQQVDKSTMEKAKVDSIPRGIVKDEKSLTLLEEAKASGANKPIAGTPNIRSGAPMSEGIERGIQKSPEEIMSSITFGDQAQVGKKSRDDEGAGLKVDMGGANFK